MREKKTTYLYDTSVENLFISEYMPDAPGDYVKVFLYGAMESSMGNAIEVKTIGSALNMTEEDVEKAFLYFQELGAIFKKDKELVYGNLKEHLYGEKENIQEPSTEGNHRLLYNPELKELIGHIEKTTGRILSSGESQKILSWIKDDGIDTRVIAKGYTYCVQKGKDHYKYIDKVIKSWWTKGLRDGNQIDEYLDNIDKRYYEQNRIKKALGFNRGLTEKEKEIINQWFDDMQLTLEEILKACDKTAGIPNPNVKYVNAILQNKGEEKKSPINRRTVEKYYEKLRNDGENAKRQAQLELYQKVPPIKDIDERLTQRSVQLTQVLIGGGLKKGSDLDKIKEQVAHLEKERERLMLQNGFPVDFDQRKYQCSKCNDTGLNDQGGRCSCFEKAKQEAEMWDNR